LTIGKKNSDIYKKVTKIEALSYSYDQHEEFSNYINIAHARLYTYTPPDAERKNRYIWKGTVSRMYEWLR